MTATETFAFYSKPELAFACGLCVINHARDLTFGYTEIWKIQLDARGIHEFHLIIDECPQFHVVAIVIVVGQSALDETFDNGVGKSPQ